VHTAIDQRDKRLEQLIIVVRQHLKVLQ